MVGVASSAASSAIRRADRRSFAGQQGFIWSHIGWITSEANFRSELRVVRDLAKFPELMFLDRFDVLVPTILGFALFGLGAFLQHHAPGLHTTGAQMLIWGFFISTVVLAHGTFTINSLAHVFGRRRYETNDDSRNSFTLAMVTLGEGWHNNHHHFPAAARNGFFWWEIDITYYTLKLLEACGIIWDLRQVPPELLDEASARAAGGSVAYRNRAGRCHQRGEVIRDVGGRAFDRGIVGLGYVRPGRGDTCRVDQPG